MADHSASNADHGVAFQRHVTTLVLEQIGEAGFALAGSSAIREHGITNRPTNDVDLFATTATGPEEFAAAIAQAEDALTRHGYRATRTRVTSEFARFLIEAGDGPTSTQEAGLVVEMDFGIDWRREPPAQLAIGPVLALRDAVGSKIAAVYSRAEVRDFLDLDAIRQSGRFTDRDLIELAKDHDPGFDFAMFIRQLGLVRDVGVVETAEYDVARDQLHEIQTRLSGWATDLLRQMPEADPHPPPLQAPTPQPRLAQRPERRVVPPHDRPAPGEHRDSGGPSIGF